MMRILLVLAAVFGLAGCAGWDVAGNQITTAQAQYLASQEARATRESEDMRQVIGAIQALGTNGDTTSRVAALMMMDRLSGGVAAQRSAQQQMPAQEGPITTALRVVAPFVLPLAQIWQADRAGERGMRQSFANMNLISGLAGQIQRDPLVMTTPAPQVIQAPAPTVITTPPAQIIERPAPIIVDQPVIVTVPAGG